MLEVMGGCQYLTSPHHHLRRRRPLHHRFSVDVLAQALTVRDCKTRCASHRFIVIDFIFNGYGNSYLDGGVKL